MSFSVLYCVKLSCLLWLLLVVAICQTFCVFEELDDFEENFTTHLMGEPSVGIELMLLSQTRVLEV